MREAAAFLLNAVLTITELVATGRFGGSGRYIRYHRRPHKADAKHGNNHQASHNVALHVKFNKLVCQWESSWLRLMPIQL